VKTALRWLLGAFLFASGVYHFARPAVYVAMIPPYLPDPLVLVYVSGAAELAGAVGLQIAKTRRAAAWGIILLFILIFPANLHMAMNDLPLGGMHLPSWALWARLPFQGVFILWAYWYTRE
jgi:uncharacterized membrane protein